MRHLRRARSQVAHRHEVLLAALKAALPALQPRPARAGLHLYLPLPPGVGEQDLKERAAAHGLGLSGVAEYAQLAQPPALLLAFAHLEPEAIRGAVGRLAAAFGELVSQNEVGSAVRSLTLEGGGLGRG